MSGSLEEILEKLRLGDESVETEAKRGGKIDTAVLQTVSAFSNEPGRGGGYILLGVEEEPGTLFGGTFVVVGVPNAGKLQADLATRCRNDLSPPVRPIVTVEAYQGKSVVVAFVPEAIAGDKPVFIRSEGLPRGAYRRIGSTDQHCTDDDLAVLYHRRGTTPYDAGPVEDAGPEDVDPASLAEYRRQRAKVKPDAAELSLSDDDLLYALGAMTVREGRPVLTVAGLMLFGRELSLRRIAPLVRVDYIRVEGREWVPDPERRYTGVELRGPLLILIPRVVAQVLDELPKAFSLSEGDIHRRDVPVVPRTVIREAVVNALMHRTYRTASPVQIIRYANRIEIRNPGASLVAEDRLGEPGSFPRNEKIAAALHEVGLAETKGTGIRAMRAAMHDANLTPPLFESDRQKDEFRVMLLVHHLLGPDDLTWLAKFKELRLSAEEARALVVIREAGAITNAMYRDINSVDTLTASGALRRLRDAGLLEQRGKGRATYYLPTRVLLGQSMDDGGSSDGSLTANGTQPQGLRAQSYGPETLPDGFGTLSDGLPEPLPTELAELVAALGKRSGPEHVKDVIVRLCAWRPLRLAQLAHLLHRNPDYIRGQYVYPLVQARRLQYTLPDNPAHPRQAYRAVTKAEQP
ncbi:MAG: putative DNA binding domain-containing protein [Phycisphaerae bacterium]|nr:putative DNA binding domain-containing protein [Phycisphaerae bacterium]